MTDKHEQLTGEEAFVNTGKDKLTVGDYWQWACSDILNNTDLGAMAEFLVAKALGDDAKKMNSWHEFDIEYRGKGVEVKCSAYVQTWDKQAAPQEKRAPQFDIGKHKRWELSKDGRWIPIDDEERWADVYVLCLFAEEDLSKADESVRDLSKWKFWVVPTEAFEVLDKKSTSKSKYQKSARLSTIKTLVGKPIGYDDIKQTVDDAIG